MNTRHSREDIKQEIGSIIESYNLDLYDLEYPSLESSTLRVFISKKKSPEKVVKATKEEAATVTEGISRNGVTLEECARISRQIINWLEEQQVAGSEDWGIEVSSPGVNRKLRTLEHFQNAVGERIKLTYREQAKLKTELMKLEKIEGESLFFALISGKAKKAKRSPSAVKPGSSEKNLQVEFADIEEAHIDFDFN